MNLFDGKDDSIETLTDPISGGKLIPGRSKSPPASSSDSSVVDLETNIAKSFFGYSLPALWSASRTYGFIIDSGYSCSENDQLEDYLD